jgi:hypothetical protein
MIRRLAAPKPATEISSRRLHAISTHDLTSHPQQRENSQWVSILRDKNTTILYSHVRNKNGSAIVQAT